MKLTNANTEMPEHNDTKTSTPESLAFLVLAGVRFELGAFVAHGGLIFRVSIGCLCFETIEGLILLILCLMRCRQLHDKPMLTRRAELLATQHTAFN